MIENVVGWIAAWFALLGSGLLAMNSVRWSRWGFVAFLASNSLWITWAFYTGATHVLMQNIGFTLTSSYGVYRWLRSDLGNRGLSRFQKCLSSVQITFQVIRLRWAASRMPGLADARPAGISGTMSCRTLHRVSIMRGAFLFFWGRLLVGWKEGAMW